MFTWHGLSPLGKLNQSLTEKRYIKPLRDHLHHFTYFNDDEMFQDDNAPSHQSYIVSDWFEAYFEQFQHMIRSHSLPRSKVILAQIPAPTITMQPIARLNIPSEKRYPMIFVASAYFSPKLKIKTYLRDSPAVF